MHAQDVVTPWWYPSQTGGGALNEDRVVRPVPAGTAEPVPESKPKVKAKNDPELVRFVRELRDRWLEDVNDPATAALLPTAARYDVARLARAAAVSARRVEARDVPLLPAA